MQLHVSDIIISSFPKESFTSHFIWWKKNWITVKNTHTGYLLQVMDNIVEHCLVEVGQLVKEIQQQLHLRVTCKLCHYVFHRIYNETFKSLTFIKNIQKVSNWFLTVSTHNDTGLWVVYLPCPWLTWVSSQHLFFELGQDPVCDLYSGLELCHIGQGGRKRIQDRLLIGHCHQAPTNS